MGVVIKRDGRKQNFSPAKVKKAVTLACKDAGLSASRTKELIISVADPVIEMYKNKRVRSVDLRRSVLRRLDRKARSASSAWRRYEKKH